MIKPDYLSFSSIEGKAKEQLNEEADKTHELFMKCANAPRAALENLMETDFKVAVAMSKNVKNFIQAESATKAAIAFLSPLMGPFGGPEFIEANIPGLKVPKKQLKT